MIEKFFVKILNRLLSKVEIERKRNIFPQYENVTIAPNLIIGNYCNIQMPYNNIKVIIKSGVGFRQFCNLLVYPNAELIIQENVFFNNYCSINCLGKISIGDNTLFGEGVKLYDHNHLFYSQDRNLIIERDKHSIGFIKIGKNCWIASNVTILQNVEIGDNVIIGANNLIYKSVPSNTIVKAKMEQNIQYL